MNESSAPGTTPLSTVELPELARLRLYSERDPSGEVRAIYLIKLQDGLALWSEGGSLDAVAPALPVPPAAVAAVFRRYGKPLEDGLDLPAHLASDAPEDEPLIVSEKSGTARLRRFQFRPYGFTHALDYLLWEPMRTAAEDLVPLAAPAPLIASALLALGKAATRRD
jgi:hypothetical protein